MKKWFEKRRKNKIKKFNREICEQIPLLKPADDPDYDYSYLVGDLEIPRGWIPLFRMMCSDLSYILISAHCFDHFSFEQIKEKYGKMTVYFTFDFENTEQAVYELLEETIDKYCHMSEYICCQCGRPTTIYFRTNKLSICGDCFDKNRKQWFNCPDITNISSSENIYSFKTYYRCGGKLKEKIIDCSDEWDRYIAIYRKDRRKRWWN